jgi:acetyl-CoA synthetase
LRAELLDRVAGSLGKALRPRDVRFTTALPRTRNAKVMRRVIRAAYLGEDPGDLSSLEDPAAVEAIRQAR